MPEDSKRALTQALIDAGRRLDGLGLVLARDGNLSVRLGPNRVLITATGVRKREITPERLVEVDIERTVVGEGQASSELGMHLAVYRLRPDAGAVVHAHPPVATGFACAGRGLTEPLLPEAVVHLGPVPIVPYATPGSLELEAEIEQAAGEHQGFLLANHGAVTLGATIEEATDRMETLEHLARITFVANLLGGYTPLSPKQLAPLEKLMGLGASHR
jgi:L-fuculose-phosphate aldolase